FGENLSLNEVQSKNLAFGENLSLNEVQSKNLAFGENLSLNDVQSKNLAFGENLSGFASRKIDNPDASKGFSFINPSIVNYPKGQEGMREGCLSLPGWDGIVARSKRITVKAQDVEGRTFKLQAKGLLAKVLQHEYDHLQGVLICDKWKDQRRVKGKELRIKGVVFFGDSVYSHVVLDKLKGTPYEPEVVIGKDTQYNILNTKYLIGITAAYGAIIPQEVIKKFRYGILNIHPSLLPKYRGPSPVQSTIMNGDTVAGVSIIKLNEKVDSGDIIAQKEFVIDKSYTAGQLHSLLFRLGANILLEILGLWISGRIIPQRQDESEASYTAFIKKDDGLIDWNESAQKIERKIRAYQPWPSVYTFFGHRGKILRVQLLDAQIKDPLTSHSEPGNIVRKDQELYVECGQDSLFIKKLRPEGKKEMSGEEFLRGYGNNSKLQFKS
ncbi:MAG: methionyl-tRNA formyltransferase, partial [Candidatus Portnoybacteria bacterium]|nr:methionyl-tRNA formyltransferase [Candidatus Portnoybacteria bacterium]